MSVSDEFLTRAKKMAGALKRVPSPTEIRERFMDNGTELTTGQARSLFMSLKAWDRKKDAPAPASKSSTKSRSRTNKPQKSGRSFGR